MPLPKMSTDGHPPGYPLPLPNEAERWKPFYLTPEETAERERAELRARVDQLVEEVAALRAALPWGWALVNGVWKRAPVAAWNDGGGDPIKDMQACIEQQARVRIRRW